jgi:uncharacterized repeat protein (TIGR01451 family)
MAICATGGLICGLFVITAPVASAVGPLTLTPSSAVIAPGGSLNVVVKNTDPRRSTSALTATVTFDPSDAPFSVTNGCQGVALGKGKTCTVTIAYTSTIAPAADQTATLSVQSKKPGVVGAVTGVYTVQHLGADIKVNKTIPPFLTGDETSTVKFVAVLAGGNPVTDPEGTCSITLTAGQTVGWTCTITGLDPNTSYDIHETDTGGFDFQQPQPISTGAGGSVTEVLFQNTFLAFATASAVKITSPAGSEGGWRFILNRDNAPAGPGPEDGQVDAGLTDATGLFVFDQQALNQEGNYYITETNQAGWTSDGGVNCTFSVNYPANRATVFDDCVFTNTRPPNVTINQAAGQADPTSASPINFTVVFDKAVSGFASGDVSLSGTAGATTAVVTETAPNNGTTYDVAVSGMTSDGNVIASILANVATDADGNGNTASTSTDNTVTFDLDTSTSQADLSITKTDGSVSYVAGGNTTYTIVVSNTGPSAAATGVTVVDQLPAVLENATFTATSTGGATGFTASGSGSINDTGIQMPVGSTITYTLTATVSSSATGSLVNTATVSPPAGTTDTNPANNSATDTDSSALRTVTLVLNLIVPLSTDATGRSVYIAGLLDGLDPPGPVWDPGGVVLTRVDVTHWTITLAGKEGTQIQYLYTLGDWEHVERGGVCEEVANRVLTLSYGASGTQTVNDTVQNWRNVAPCGP